LWRSSQNQYFYSPTGKYDLGMIQKLTNEKSAGLEIVVKNNNLFIYGIPTSNVFELLKDRLANKGINLSL